MAGASAGRRVLTGLVAWLAAATASLAAPDARFEPVAFDEVAGFAADDLAAAFAVFRRACASRRAAPSSPGLAPPPGLGRVCARALALKAAQQAAAEAFFRDHFAAFAVQADPPTGLLTGYYEPELDGSLVATRDFAAPLLARPDPPPSPFPSRAEIEDGALGATAKPVVFLRDAVDAFVVHVQGSTRVRLPDGKVVRVAFDGRNGHPYTSVGRLLAQRLDVPPAEMTADRLSAWLRENPDEGRALMRENRSYIFFRLETGLDPGEGPIGAAGLPLTPGRSLAVDNSLWAYGLPIWLAAQPGSETFPGGGRLVIAQDTGAAIVGSMRGDLFVGTGREAGAVAGRLRERVGFVVLWPKDEPPPAWSEPAAPVNP